MILGIDVSTKRIAVCHAERDFYRVASDTWQHTVTEGAHAVDRFVEFIKVWDSHLRELIPDVEMAFIEDVPFVRNRSGTIDLAQFVGAVCAICTVHYVPFKLINNVSWKSKLKIKGGKPGIMKYVQGNYILPYLPTITQDEADAVCIAEYGIRTLYEGS